MLVLSPRNTPFRDYETFLPLSRRTTISSSDWPFYPSGNSTRPTFLDDGATTTSDRNDCRFALPTSAFGEGRGVLHFYEILRPHPTVHNTPATALSAWRRVRVLFTALSSCNSRATIYTKSILHLSPSPSLAREMSAKKPRTWNLSARVSVREKFPRVSRCVSPSLKRQLRRDLGDAGKNSLVNIPSHSLPRFPRGKISCPSTDSGITDV